MLTMIVQIDIRGFAPFMQEGRSCGLNKSPVPVVYHGEGPVWSESWGWLALGRHAGRRYYVPGADGAVSRRHVSSVVAVLRPRERGGAIIGVERGFALEGAEGRLTFMPELWSGDQVRMNEGGCDPDGRFYCGSMAYNHKPGAGSLYRLDPDGSVRAVLDDVTISNGLEWSPDGSLAYHNDMDDLLHLGLRLRPRGGIDRAAAIRGSLG